MKAVILAAGQGTRLQPLTNDKPKCMVEFRNKPIIHYITQTLKDCGISDIAIVNGYKKDVLENYFINDNIKWYTNESYASTNMVKTLFCAKEFFDDDLIISYADIIFNKKILNCIMKSNYDFNVVVDKDWEILWNLRMENPLEDAETLKIIDDNIVEIGKRALDITEIHGQYIGLVKISKSALLNLVKFYESLDKTKMYEGKDFDNMYMTTLIQLIIDHVSNVTPVYVNGGWIEIDSFDDLNIYCSNEKLTSKILNL